MSRVFVVTLLAGVLGVLPACQNGSGGDVGWSPADAAACEMIEMQVDGTGKRVEIEYAVLPEAVPPAVRGAAQRMYPGANFTEGEKEYQDGGWYYELGGMLEGRELEAMFRADGTPYQQEIQIAPESVPAAVQSAVRTGFAGATVTAWEEIRSGTGALLEYHVKLTKGDRKYKLLLSTSGSVLGLYREVPAEIEVPVPAMQ